MARLRVSKAAGADLRAIFRTSAEMFGLAQADAYVRGLLQAMDTIVAYPEAHRVHEETTPPVRVGPHKSHLIVYALDEQGVLVVRIRHGHEDWRNDAGGLGSKRNEP